jgi:hypothetical protein
MKQLPKILLTLAASMGVFLFAFAAFGQPCPPVDVVIHEAEAAQQEWWMVLLIGLMDIIAPVVISILGALAAVAIRKLGKKWDVETQDKFIGLTQSMIASGISFAEEQGRKALRAGEDQTDGATKMAHAVSFVQERLDESGVGQMAEDKLVQLIESRLMKERSRPHGAIPSDDPTALPKPTPKPAPAAEDTPDE